MAKGSGGVKYSRKGGRRHERQRYAELTATAAASTSGQRNAADCRRTSAIAARANSVTSMSIATPESHRSMREQGLVGNADHPAFRGSACAARSRAAGRAGTGARGRRSSLIST